MCIKRLKVNSLCKNEMLLFKREKKDEEITNIKTFYFDSSCDFDG